MYPKGTKKAIHHVLKRTYFLARFQKIKHKKVKIKKPYTWHQEISKKKRGESSS
nr:MAG: hypothetical protein [Bacteriophage sp.]